LRDLLDGTQRPPYWHTDEVVPGYVQFLRLAEIARQFNVSIYACASWKGEGNTMLISQKSQLIDHHHDDTFTMDVVRQHFADFVCRTVGTPGRLWPSEAYPVPYPDSAMQGRPALPPEHAAWEQERDNIIEWFSYLYLWQGGSVGPNWDRIKEDIDGMKYETIDRHRLPVEHTPLKRPNDWDEHTTRIWSRHIRSTMNQFGCVNPDRTESAFQFRALYHADGKLAFEDITFRTKCFERTTLRYYSPSFMYSKRVLRTTPETGEVDKARANDIYPPQFIARVQEAAALVPEIMDLWESLRRYESRNPPQAAAPLNADLLSWPRAAQRIGQDREGFLKNYTDWEYTEDFVNLDSDEWSSWDIPSFSRWIASNPFLDTTTQLQGGGYHGVCIGFLAILQYCWNIARVRPCDDAAAANLVQQGRAVYGPQDMYFLSRCAVTLGRFVNEALPLLPQGLPALESDHVLRRECWHPDAWLEISPGGIERELPRDQLSRIRRPAFNVFDSTYDDHTTKTDEDETRSEEQSESACQTAKTENKNGHESGNDPRLHQHTTTREGAPAVPDAADLMDVDTFEAQGRSTPATLMLLMVIFCSRDGAQQPPAGASDHATGISKSAHTPGNESGTWWTSILSSSPSAALGPETPMRPFAPPVLLPHEQGEATLNMSNFPHVLAQSTPRPLVKAAAVPDHQQPGGGGPGNIPSHPAQPIAQIKPRGTAAIPTDVLEPPVAERIHAANHPVPGVPQGSSDDVVPMDEDAARLLKHVQAWQGSSSRGGSATVAARQRNMTSSTNPGTGFGRRKPGA
ncbi:hypothetical protein FRC10_000538, partial [Ceratobasidium sp. 414]